MVGSWPAWCDVSEQPYREDLGRALSFDAFTRAVDAHGFFCILRNDAEAATGSLRKGSTQSPEMQGCALHLARSSAKVDMPYMCWHVPGLVFIAEGIDGASRGGFTFGPDANLVSVLGPAVSDALWAMVLAATDAVGWTVTVDAYATQSNARTTRFWSRFHEPGAESIDALSVLDWSSSRCPSCGLLHREIIYAFPPLCLLRPTVEKACADRALCVLVLPVSILAAHWNKLLSASVLPLTTHGSDGFIRKPFPLLLHAQGFAPSELAIFVCDFGRLHTSSPSRTVPPCPGAYARRPRPECGSLVDRTERVRLREALLALGNPCWTLPASTFSA
jgi:hypothetical protein